MLITFLLLLGLQFAQACIPLGLNGACNCAQNPTCGQCPLLPPPPPVQQQCCSFSNDGAQLGQSIGSPNAESYAAPELLQGPTANNQYPQVLNPPQHFSQPQPVAIPIVQSGNYANQPSQNELAANNNFISDRDQELRHAINEFNKNEHATVPFPDSATQKSSKKSKYVSPPGAEPPPSDSVDEYGGLPSIYFTMRPNTSGTRPAKTTTETSNPYDSNDSATPQKANAVLEEREADSGITQQRRIPYHAYEQEVCTGATLGRSIEKNVEAVAVKCTMIGCAAVNVRPIFDEQFEAIYLKNVNTRRHIRGNKTYSCITIVDVPEHESVYQEKQKEFDEKQTRRMPATINQPTRLRFISVEPKAI